MPIIALFLEEECCAHYILLGIVASLPNMDAPAQMDVEGAAYVSSWIGK